MLCRRLAQALRPQHRAARVPPTAAPRVSLTHCPWPWPAPAAALQVHLEEGTLVCPETGRRFPVNKGIPNLLLNEDEC
jgi:uncharacterized protein YbaR (Trm112 family)